MNKSINSILVKMVFGSHLYGLNTPNSDMDYKGIFVPNFEDLLLSKAPKSIVQNTGPENEKNSSSDVDEEFYSLKYFLDLALKGETVAIDMLHCKDPLVCTPEWNYLVSNRQSFYTKNLKAFMGYLRRQVAKYSVKGSRLADISRVLDVLKNIDAPDILVLSDVWDILPTGEYLRKITKDKNTFYEVNSKLYQNTLTVEKLHKNLQSMYDSYGARAKIAEKNDSIDWKAVSHAFRAGYQLRDIYTDGDFEYPLRETKFIKDIKMGKFDFKNRVQPILEDLCRDVEQLALHSDFPDYPDYKLWERYTLETYKSKLILDRTW